MLFVSWNTATVNKKQEKFLKKYFLSNKVLGRPQNEASILCLEYARSQDCSIKYYSSQEHFKKGSFHTSLAFLNNGVPHNSLICTEKQRLEHGVR